MAAAIGNIIDTWQIADLAEGTQLVKVGSTEVKTRKTTNHNFFSDGSKANSPENQGAKWVVVGLPEENTPDLSSREGVALLLRRAYTGNETLNQLGWERMEYLAQADAVLKAFELKGDRTLRVGARVKVTNTDRGWAAPYQVGQYAKVEIEDSSDGTWFVRFEGSESGYWVHGTEVEVVS